MRANSILSATTAVMFGLSGTAVLAEDLCGGTGNNGQWIGGTEAASDIAQSDTYLEQMALVLGGNQYVALFNLSADADVRVETAGRGTGDTVLDLYDAQGNIVLSDDDSGGNGASRAETSLIAGTYCLAMRSFDNAPMTGFVRVGLTDHEALTQGMSAEDMPDGDEMAGDSLACTSDTAAGDLSVGASVTASVDEQPYWRFTLDRDMAVTIRAENPNADPLVTLYDQTGSYVSENDDFDGLNSQLDIAAPLAAGTYCIAMRALSDPAEPITISLTEYDPVAALMGQYDRAEAAPPLDGSYPVTSLGTLPGRMRQDSTLSETAQWYSFDVTEAGLVLVEAIATGGNGDPSLYMFDDLGRRVGYNDDNGEGYDSLLSARVLPGTYLVAVKDVGSSQSMVRMVFERYLPAK
jgi:hypothetical protein